MHNTAGHQLGETPTLYYSTKFITFNKVESHLLKAFKSKIDQTWNTDIKWNWWKIKKQLDVEQDIIDFLILFTINKQELTENYISKLRYDTYQISNIFMPEHLVKFFKIILDTDNLPKCFNIIQILQ